MSARRKPFRIENVNTVGSVQPIAVPANNGAGHAEIMGELSTIRSLLAKDGAAEQPAAVELNKSLLEDLKAEMAQVAPLKQELDDIYDAIAKTKTEIASMHVSGFEGDDMNRVTDELDAVVIGTETATEKILSAAEIIDDRSSTLAAMLKKKGDQGLASDIQDQVVEIFESCNFQDLTGQRITKVVSTLRFIEDRIIRMMEIWGGMENFKEIDIVDELKREGDAALLNGPALEGQVDVASQDDIDALFN